MLLRALLGALCVSVSWRSVNALKTITTSTELAAVERSAKVHALLILGTEETEERSLEELATMAYPSLPDLEKQLEGLVTFGVVDISPHHKDSIGNKWQLAKAPALVIYKDAPKENPYTGKIYRDSKATDAAILDSPRKLKKMLKQAIPNEYVQELEGDKATLKSFEQLVNEKVNEEETVALLISKQKHASPMYRALAAEFNGQGLSFVFLNRDEQGAEEIMNALKIEELPGMVVLRSMTEHVVLKAENTKTYGELKGFVEPFATEKERTATSGVKKGKEASKFIRFFSGKDFDDLVLHSNVVWIIEFMNAEREQALTEEEWKKSLTELHRKAGVVAMGAVSCEKEAELCERHGGPGVRVFPLALTEDNKLKRGDVLTQTFTTIDEAKESAIAAIPDLTVEIKSTADLNGFISHARENRALPILLFTTKKSTPPMIKALVLSVPTQKVRLAVIHDADEDLKKQFLVKPSASTSLVCLVPTKTDSEDPTAAPFGVVAYEKKKMGAYNYPNIMQFILQVLAQYPHPQDAKPESEEINFSSLDEKAARSLVPYLTKKNMDDLCGGNKICAIGFFEDHLDTLSDPESRLAKCQSKQNKEPFRFMWVNGKCQKDFAEAFGVGLFQMPTLAVYSPSKQRYATNVGLFDEENAAAFLRSVLSGSIGTAPIGNVPELGEECSFDEIQEVALGADGVTEDDEDLDDMLSEILSDEKQQRDELEKELKSEEKQSKKSKKKHKSKKKKSKKKKARDEL
ncbi:ABC transporter B family member 11 [Phytophthora nicotianae]|uniref:ABC transporter B family member 11 n=1 Tax=Phytophthora nicotianae TaxID=4792 RepID=A0A0W8D521_PHYNI|nr:ABC transporter B family member 11 [Phytophthora nicotianae]